MVWNLSRRTSVEGEGRGREVTQGAGRRAGGAEGRAGRLM